MSTVHKTLARRLYEDVLGRKDMALLDELVAPDAVDHLARRQGWPAGATGFRQNVAFFHSVLQDLRVTVDELLAEDDRVVVFWRVDGVQSSMLWGVKPNGQRITGSTISSLKFRDGRIVEYRSRPDRVGFLLQLGSLGDHAGQFVFDIA